jgi:hypothetical protein
MFSGIKIYEKHDNKPHIQHSCYEQYINNEHEQHNNNEHNIIMKIPQTDVVLQLYPSSNFVQAEALPKTD